MSILEYSWEEFLEDTKQEQLENKELKLQLEKERREREEERKENEAAIQAEREEKEAAIQAEREEKEAAIQAERKEKDTAILSFQRGIILNMRKNNKSFEEIAQYTALDTDTIRKLAENEDDI